MMFLLPFCALPVVVPLLVKNILICVPKMNEGIKGLERHEGE